MPGQIGNWYAARCLLLNGQTDLRRSTLVPDTGQEYSYVLGLGCGVSDVKVAQIAARRSFNPGILTEKKVERLSFIILLFWLENFSIEENRKVDRKADRSVIDKQINVSNIALCNTNYRNTLFIHLNLEKCHIFNEIYYIKDNLFSINLIRIFKHKLILNRTNHETEMKTVLQVIRAYCAPQWKNLRMFSQVEIIARIQRNLWSTQLQFLFVRVAGHICKMRCTQVCLLFFKQNQRNILLPYWKFYAWNFISCALRHSTVKY